jgi:small subunit ribosomal protein S2
MADACLEGTEAREKNLRTDAEGGETEAAAEPAEVEAAPEEVPAEAPAAPEAPAAAE